MLTVATEKTQGDSIPLKIIIPLAVIVIVIGLVLTCRYVITRKHGRAEIELIDGKET